MTFSLVFRSPLNLLYILRCYKSKENVALRWGGGAETSAVTFHNRISLAVNAPGSLGGSKYLLKGAAVSGIERAGVRGHSDDAVQDQRTCRLDWSFRD